MTLRIHPDDAPLFENVSRIWDPAGRAWTGVESSRSYSDRLVLKLEGVDDANAASAWRGRVLEAERTELPALEAGEWWNDELIGLRLLVDGNDVGTVQGLVPTPGQQLLEVERADGEEALIPLVGEWVESLDVSAGELRMQLPAGLLEINDVSADSPDAEPGGDDATDSGDS